jgi:hypothetical protein
VNLPYDTVEHLFDSWGAWRNRELRQSPRPLVVGDNSQDTGSYWRPCRTCRREPGRVYDVVTGQKQVCPDCRGRKGRWISYDKADPKAIPATGPGGMYVTFDAPAEFLAIERILDDLGPVPRAVIESRYVVQPRRRTAGGKLARVAWANHRLAPHRISRTLWDWWLVEAKRKIGEVLELPTRKDLREQAKSRRKRRRRTVTKP